MTSMNTPLQNGNVLRYCLSRHILPRSQFVHSRKDMQSEIPERRLHWIVSNPDRALGCGGWSAIECRMWPSLGQVGCPPIDYREKAERDL
jgi:hypothetical protein